MNRKQADKLKDMQIKFGHLPQDVVES